MELVVRESGDIMATVRNVVVRVGADVSGMQKSLNSASKTLKGFGDGMKKAGSTMTKYVTAPIIGLGTASTKMGMDFNKSMANVATLIPGNVERVNELKQSVLDLSIETGKSAQDISAGLYQVISAFGDSADAAKQLEVAVKAATAGVSTTEEAINLLSAVTKGYGDTSLEAMEKVSDLAFMTVKLGQEWPGSSEMNCNKNVVKTVKPKSAYFKKLWYNITKVNKSVRGENASFKKMLCVQ